ncbi:hypothetical protein F4859DRAFT_515381 [Xylaria cf. heliscus]|nr:hypothetical protein F4859DRAFT_515381 [Xylaria cf. heliscus]
MLGSLGFNVAYVLISITNNYCLHRLDVALDELGMGHEDTIVMTFDATSILGIRKTRADGIIASSPTPASAIGSASNSTSATPSTSTATSKTTSTTTSNLTSVTTPTFTDASKISSLLDSVTTAVESSTTIGSSVIEKPQDIKSRKAVKSKVVIEPQATLEFPVPTEVPAPQLDEFEEFDWVSIYEHSKGQKHPFNLLTSISELEDLQRTTAESVDLRRELRDIAKAQPRRAMQANGLGEVLAFVAIAPLRNISKIVTELQDRVVNYNTNRPRRASDSIEIGPFIEGALEKLELTKPGAEGLSPSAKQAYSSMANITKVDPKYCFDKNCEWRARVVDRWRDVNQKRDFFTARLSEVNKQLLAKDEAEWQTVLWAVKTFAWLLPAYTVLLIFIRLFTMGWPLSGGPTYAQDPQPDASNAELGGDDDMDDDDNLDDDDDLDEEEDPDDEEEPADENELGRQGEWADEAELAVLVATG